MAGRKDSKVGKSPLPLATMVTMQNTMNKETINQKKFDSLMRFSVEQISLPNDLDKKQNAYRNTNSSLALDTYLRQFSTSQERLNDYLQRTQQNAEGEVKLVQPQVNSHSVLQGRPPPKFNYTLGS